MYIYTQTYKRCPSVGLNTKSQTWLSHGKVTKISVLVAWYMEKDEVGVWLLKGFYNIIDKMLSRMHMGER